MLLWRVPLRPEQLDPYYEHRLQRETAMHTRKLILMLAILSMGGVGGAQALEFPQTAPAGPPMYTSPSGFVGVPGPGYYQIERWNGLPPVAAAAPTCSSCPAPAPTSQATPLPPH
jgi:hypothetical protein